MAGQSVGIIDAGLTSLSPLAQQIALALGGHASTPRTVTMHALHASLDSFLSSEEVSSTNIVLIPV